jgi:putative peptide maturation dehydrogenase
MPMLLRRCAVLHLEPRERLVVDLEGVSSGDSGLGRLIEWVALSPHLGDEIVLSAQEAATLGGLSPSQWKSREDLARQYPLDALDSLVTKELLVAQDSTADSRDRQLRDAHWREGSAVFHYFSRWRGVDTRDAEKRYAELSEGTFLEYLGPPPPSVNERAAAQARFPLPRPGTSPLEVLLSRRVTCRNFDLSRPLNFQDFSTVLYRAFGARAVHEYAPGVELLKKGVPSAGSLHPTEAYLLVQRVEGVAPGLYHYHPVQHALEPLRDLRPDETEALAYRLVAGQIYFVTTPVMVIPTVRFRRNFWKYRHHAKAYRATLLDIGHLSQTLYLAATELGLGAFITAAINEVDVEESFGLNPLEEGPLAICGFGHRGSERNEVEFDPLGAVWPGGGK